MAIHIRRREFIAALGGAAVAWHDPDALPEARQASVNSSNLSKMGRLGKATARNPLNFTPKKKRFFTMKIGRQNFES
jgi:hypothetical protein